VSDKHAGMTLGEIAVQAATSGECELTKVAFSYIRFGNIQEPCNQLFIYLNVEHTYLLAMNKQFVSGVSQEYVNNDVKAAIVLI